MSAGSEEHLDVEECPETLRLLERLFDVQLRTNPDRLAARGFERTSRGAWVHWARLADSDLRALDKAVVHIAYGCSVLERTGGINPSLSAVLVDTVTAVAEVHDPPHPPPTPPYRHLRVIEPPP